MIAHMGETQDTNRVTLEISGARTTTMDDDDGDDDGGDDDDNE